MIKVGEKFKAVAFIIEGGARQLGPYLGGEKKEQSIF
jgi:hypothetical protein